MLVEMLDGTHYEVKTLLAKGSQNAKTAKSEKDGRGILTYSLSLAPHTASGFNLCSSASLGCIKGCLHTAGMAIIHGEMISRARIAKARYLRLHKEEFEKHLRRELEAAQRRADRLGARLFVRLNIVSDVMWEREFPSLMSDFPRVQFYDYTKHFLRMIRWCKGELPTNYHLTFSRSEDNHEKSLEVLRQGGNVAIPFQVKYNWKRKGPLPKTFRGFNIIDGDLTDLRPLDGKWAKGRVIGLRAKGRAKKDASGFVIVPR